MSSLDAVYLRRVHRQLSKPVGKIGVLEHRSHVECRCDETKARIDSLSLMHSLRSTESILLATSDASVPLHLKSVLPDSPNAIRYGGCSRHA